MDNWSDFGKETHRGLKEIVMALLEKRWSSAFLSALFSIIAFVFRYLEKKLQ